MKLIERLSESGLFGSYPMEYRAALIAAFGAQGGSPNISADKAQGLMRRWKMERPKMMVRLLDVAGDLGSATVTAVRKGAIACGGHRDLYFGANIEFPGDAMGFSMHAEQAALVNAWVHGETEIIEMAVMEPPCGHCRQFLYEALPDDHADMGIILAGSNAEAVYNSLRDLLPDAFGPVDVGVTLPLLKGRFNHLVFSGSGTKIGADPTATAALIAANISYAPYTTNVRERPFKFGYAEVGITTSDGQRYIGPYCETFGLNTSISPMAAALSQVNLRAEIKEITDAVLVEVAGSPNSHAESSRAILATRTDVPLRIRHAAATPMGVLAGG